MQDNKALFWLSIVVRGANVVLFASFGGKWTALAGAATLTAGKERAVMEGGRYSQDVWNGRPLLLRGIGRERQLCIADTGR